MTIFTQLKTMFTNVAFRVELSLNSYFRKDEENNSGFSTLAKNTF